MPGRMEFDFVDPVSARIVTAQHGRVLVCQPGPLLGIRCAGQPAQLVQFRGRPGCTFPAGRAEQRRIVGHVVPGERRHLVQHFVRHVRAGKGHRQLPLLW